MRRVTHYICRLLRIRLGYSFEAGHIIWKTSAVPFLRHARPLLRFMDVAGWTNGRVRYYCRLGMPKVRQGCDEGDSTRTISSWTGTIDTL